ncbi:MAG: tetratricopeptide repeat protein [Flavobacteriales bacterium]
MKKIVALFLILGLFSQKVTAQSDSTKTLNERAKIQVWMLDAFNKQMSYNYRGALQVYREVLNIDKKHAKANYGAAECQFSLGNYQSALSYITKAIETDSEVNKEAGLLLGRILHRLARLDEAVVAFNEFKATLKSEKAITDSRIDLYIKQCEYAKKAMQNKVDVEIVNLGEKINTVYPEYAPVISADGKSMYFTSRRPDTKGGEVDNTGDFKYFEDIYYTEWDEKENDWGTVQPVPGRINTEFFDAALGISPDGSQLFIYRNITRVTGSGDIWVSKLSSSGKWGSPQPMTKPKRNSINSSYFESAASITADGNTFYFVSERPGGFGQADIYVATKVGKEWGKPVNIGSKINTSYDEKFVYVTPDGNTLFFGSEGHENLGGYDIFVSQKDANGEWSTPKNLGYPINTVKEEKTFTVTSDGKYAYIGAEYEDSRGDFDIYRIDISKLDLIKK